jgi:RNA polymerase sigma-70 factor (sigma-E family)
MTWTAAEAEAGVAQVADGTEARGSEADPPPVLVVAQATALEAVYLDAYPRLVGLARTILAGADGAEEVVQEAFVRTLARWRGIERPDDPLPYVRSAVVNLCRSRFRRKVVPLRPPGSEPSAEAAAAGNARRDAVLTALATLPTRQREVVALRYFGGLSTAEAARELSIAEGTVKAHLHRGLAALREHLEDERP